MSLEAFRSVGGWLTLLGIAIIGVPFGVAHVVQTISITPDWCSSRERFMVGLLNPSFAFLKVVGLFRLSPGIMS